LCSSRKNDLKGKIFWAGRNLPGRGGKKGGISEK
jgi:hypothetical protein